MMERKFNFHDGKMGAAITVHVISGAGQNAFGGILEDGTVTVNLGGPQEEAKSNQMLVKYLAEVLQVNPTQVEIISGLSGKDKLVTILGVDSAFVQSRILELIK